LVPQRATVSSSKKPGLRPSPLKKTLTGTWLFRSGPGLVRLFSRRASFFRSGLR
jgi:hypothetical protein